MELIHQSKDVMDGAVLRRVISPGPTPTRAALFLIVVPTLQALPSKVDEKAEAFNMLLVLPPSL